MIVFQNRYTNRSDITLKYFQEVDRIPLLTTEEEVELCTRREQN